MKRFGVLWDLDGTITDSFDCFFAGLLEFLKINEFDVTLDRDAYKRQYFGQTVDYVLNSILPVKLSEERLRTLSVAYTDLCAERAKVKGAIGMLPEVDRIIRELHAAKVPQAIGSSSVLKMIQRELECVGLFDFFDNIVSGSLLPSKPAPDIFRLAAATLGLDARDCIVFEDSLAGVQAAKAAGARCIAITTARKREELHEADLVIDRYAGLTMEQLIGLL